MSVANVYYNNSLEASIWLYQGCVAFFAGVKQEGYASVWYFCYGTTTCKVIYYDVWAFFKNYNLA
jgi:hypothetical protein